MRVELILDGIRESSSESSGMEGGTKVGSANPSPSEEEDILRTRPRLRLRLRLRLLLPCLRLREEEDDLRDDLRPTRPNSVAWTSSDSADRGDSAVVSTEVVDEEFEEELPSLYLKDEIEERKLRAMLNVTLAVAEMRTKSVMRVKSKEDFPRISAKALRGMRRMRKRRVKGGVRRNMAEMTASSR